MRGFRSSSTSAVIAAASLLLPYQTGAQLFTVDYTHMGCFMDSKEDRVLEHKLVAAEKTTAEFCYDYCDGMNAPLMATQYGTECWCATEAGVEYQRHGGGAQCDYPCAGDEDEMCGGYYAFDLYLLESTGASREPEMTPEGALNEDIVKIVEVVGDDPGGVRWADSYSVGGKCYMQTTFDHDIGEVEVDTPQGTMTIKELFDALEPAPGSEGRPLYNDIQCGNGPPNTSPDEVDCPGLVEYGREGCGQIGPMWDLSELE